jgi:hypothetical protein
VKGPVTCGSCNAFVISDACITVPKSPAFTPSIPAKTETVSGAATGGSDLRALAYGSL